MPENQTETPVAAEERTAAVPTITLTDEQYDRLFGGDGAPTEAEIAAETEALAPTREATGAPALDAGAGRERVIGDRLPSWRLRAVRYIKYALWEGSAEREMRTAARLGIDELTRQTLDMSQAQFDEEGRAAREIIDQSDLPPKSKRRVRHIVELYEEDLGRLRAVPAERRSVSPFAPESRQQSTLSDTAGGYLVPRPFLAEIFVFIEMYGYARRIMRFVTMTSKSLEWRDIGTKPVAAWIGELGLMQKSDMTFGPGGMNAAKLYGLMALSSELDEDTMVPLLPLYTELIGEQVALKEDQAGIIGDGTQAHGGHTGLLNLGPLGATTHTLASGKTSAANIDIDDLIDIKFKISKSRRVGASWLLPETAVKGLLKLKDAEQRYYILDPQNPAGIVRLLDYPLVDPEGVNDELFHADAADTVFGALGNYQRSLFGQRRGFTVETSREGVISAADGKVTFNALTQDAQIVKVTERVAIGHPQPDAYVLIKTAAS